MLAIRDKKTIAIAVVIFLFSQTLIFAAIPRDSDPSSLNIVVKNGTSLYGIADALNDRGLIYSRVLFVLSALTFRGRLMAGEYELRRDMSTFEIVMKMGLGKRNIYTLKIIEGHNIYTIANNIERSGIMPKDEFLKLSTDKKYLERIGISSDSLEGYLFADTYFYSKEIEKEKFIEHIARRTLRFFDRNDIKEKMRSLNMDIHKTLTLASMIEKETGAAGERPFVSAVFHNRLLKGMSLDCDPTVIYGTKGFGSPIRKVDILTYTPYNTYTFKGYPRGPICSPGAPSIAAALNPAPVDHLYFVSKNDGTHVFSKDLVEHNKNVTMFQRSRTSKQ